MLPSAMLEIRYYVAADGSQPFAEWFADVEPVTRAKVARDRPDGARQPLQRKACWRGRA